MVWNISHSNKLFIGGDFNDHIEAISSGFDDVHGCFCFGDRNEMWCFASGFF